MNGTFEGYHGYLKSMLKFEISCMIGRHVDWIVISLKEEMQDHFWYKGLPKKYCFVNNKKMQDFAVMALMKAHDIPNFDMTLNVFPGNYALVISSEY